MKLNYFPRHSFKYIRLFIARLGKAPEGLCQMIRKTERKPGESTAQMRHRIYSRIYGIMWVSEFFFVALHFNGHKIFTFHNQAFQFETILVCVHYETNWFQ